MVRPEAPPEYVGDPRWAKDHLGPKVDQGFPIGEMIPQSTRFILMDQEVGLAKNHDSEDAVGCKYMPVTYIKCVSNGVDFTLCTKLSPEPKSRP